MIKRTISKNGISFYLIALAILSTLCFVRNAIAVDNWTFMVYLAADNDLEFEAIDDFLEMADVGSDDNVHILVLFDRATGFSTGYDDWTDTRRGEINKDDIPDSNWGASMGELNMGNPQTLVNFVVWGVQNFPADRYAVIMWNHGGGWRSMDLTEKEPPYKAVCVDDDSSDILSMSEVRTALTSIENTVGEIHLIGFDACLMGMIEVAYEIREHGIVMVGSEKVVPLDGWPYDTILSDLVALPSKNASSLGYTIVTRYYESYGNSEIKSSINLSGDYMSRLIDKVDSLASTLRDSWNNDRGACAAAACRVIKELDDHIVLSESHGSSWPGSHGLAIYFPETSVEFDNDYNNTNILFANDTEWEEFLQDFYSSMGGSWVADARNISQEYDVADPGFIGRHIDLYDFCEKIILSAINTLWVDFSWNGLEMGTYFQPYNTLLEGVSASSPGGNICIKEGSSSENLVIDKGLRIRSCGTATIGN